MNRLDEENRIKEFSLIGFFAVTGICFFLFSLAIKLLEGSYVSIFNKVGIFCTLLAVLLLVVKLMMPKTNKRGTETTGLQDE